MRIRAIWLFALCAVLAAAPAGAAATTPAAVTRYAPWLRFHPEEKFWPDDPSMFIARSSLVWINHDHSCAPQPLNAASVLIAPIGQVDPAKLGDGGYAVDACFRKHGREITTHLTTRDVTAPSARRDGAHRPADVIAGFALDLPDAEHQHGVAPAPGASSYGEPGAAPPLAYEYVPHKYIVYWLFTDYNDRGGDHHAGDWEHIAVRLDADNHATALAYYVHTCRGITISWSKLRSQGRLHDGEHPQAFVARGGHGTWPTDGQWIRHTFPGWPFHACGFGDKTAKGLIWRTWKTSGGFVDARTQAWYDYAGGWGQNTKGPIGPSAYKLGVAVPAEWR
jgi:hypothetical protein